MSAAFEMRKTYISLATIDLKIPETLNDGILICKYKSEHYENISN